MPTVLTGGTPTFPGVFLLRKKLGSFCYSSPISAPAAHIKPILPAVPSDVTWDGQPRTYANSSFPEVLPNLHGWPDPDHKLPLILRTQGPAVGRSWRTHNISRVQFCESVKKVCTKRCTRRCQQQILIRLLIQGDYCCRQTVKLYTVSSRTSQDSQANS